MRCALKINYAVQKVINPTLQSCYKTGYAVSQVVGIDISTIRATRTGARDDNDIVWVGPAANHAAKLTTIKQDERTWITKAVYEAATNNSKLSSGKSMWTKYTWKANGSTIYGSTWRWEL